MLLSDTDTTCVKAAEPTSKSANQWQKTHYANLAPLRAVRDIFCPNEGQRQADSKELEDRYAISRQATPLPLRHGLGVDRVTLGQSVQALLTMLYRSTHRRCRAGAAV